jgi:hypothetical protein
VQIILEIRDDQGVLITREHKIFAEPFKTMDFLNDVLPHWDALIKTMFEVTPEGNFVVKGFKK